MRTLARSAFLDSVQGVEHELPKAGTSLENPFVYDAAAKELKALASLGELKVVSEAFTTSFGERLINRLRFVRLR